MAEPVLTFDRVSKRFGANEVLKGVSFTLRRGECVALTGLNGSGKTTLLKLAGGLSRPTSGAVRTHAPVKTQYIPESFPRLNISARNVLRSFGRMEGIGKAELDEKTAGLLREFHLAEESGNPLRTYSKGMLQKVSVLQAFLGRADVLLLDEPLSGQDAQSQETFTNLSRSLLSAGMAVLLACHERHLIRALADTVYEIRDGSLHEAGIPAETGVDIYLFETPGGGFEVPEGIEGVLKAGKEGRLLSLAVRRGTGDGMLRRMLDAGCGLRGMRHEEDR